MRDTIIKWLGGYVAGDLHAVRAQEAERLQDEMRATRDEYKALATSANGKLQRYREAEARRIPVSELFRLGTPRVFTRGEMMVRDDYDGLAKTFVVRLDVRDLSVSHAFPRFYFEETDNFKEIYLLSIEKMIQSLQEAVGKELRAAAEKSTAQLPK
jgi:hypothetical protein